MSTYTDLTLEPLQLEEEFETEEQEPEQHSDSSSTDANHHPHSNDALHLKSDPHLTRFFDTIEGHHLPNMREVCLLSCEAHQRLRVDERVFQESRRPVVQGRRQKLNQYPNQPITPNEQNHQMMNKASSQQSPLSVGTAITTASSPTTSTPTPSSSTSKPSLWQRLRSPSPDSPSTPKSPQRRGSSSSSKPSTSNKISNWFKKHLNDEKNLTNSNPSQQQSQSDHSQALPRHSPSLLLNEQSPPPMIVQSPSYSTTKSPLPGVPHFSLPPTSSTRPRPNSHSGVSSSPTTSSHQTASDVERATRAPTAPPPQACTIVLSNLALYIFPPAIAVDMEPAPPSNGSSTSTSTSSHHDSTAVQPKQVKYFLVYNEYQRIALADILLVSLPYRMGLTRHGTDFALRITDFALHLRDGETTVWLQAPRNQRSRVVECISDAYENLMGLPLELQQVDYSQLLADILSRQIWTIIRELQIHAWATRTFIMSGYLYHRSLHVWPMVVESSSNSSADSTASSSATPAKIEMKMSEPSEWKRKWFVLSQDNYLLHFNSKQELEAFQFVATTAAHSSSNGSTPLNAGKFPASFDCNQIDLSKSLYLRGSQVCPDGFEIIVYPRSSSMTNNHSNESQVNDQTMMEYGYTRHLFQIPLPAISAGNKIMQVSSNIVPSAIRTASTTIATAPTRSRELNAYMEGEVNKWLSALRACMRGPGLPATPACSPQGSPKTKGLSQHSQQYPATPSSIPSATSKIRSNSSTTDDGVFSAGTPNSLRSFIPDSSSFHSSGSSSVSFLRSITPVRLDDMETIPLTTTTANTNSTTVTNSTILGQFNSAASSSSPSPPPVAKEFLVDSTPTTAATAPIIVPAATSTDSAAASHSNPVPTPDDTSSLIESAKVDSDLIRSPLRNGLSPDDALPTPELP